MKTLLLLSLMVNVPALAMGNFESPSQLRKSFDKSMVLPRLSPSPRESSQPKEQSISMSHNELVAAAMSFQKRSEQNSLTIMERYYPTNHTKALQDMQQKLHRLYKLTARFKDDSEYSMEAMIRSLSSDDAKSESLGRMLRCVDQLINDAQWIQKETQMIKNAEHRKSLPMASYDPKPDILIRGIFLAIIFGIILNIVY